LRIGITLKEKDVDFIISLLNLHKEVSINEVLLQMLRKNIGSSDILFILLQILTQDGYVEGSKGVLKIIKPIDEKEVNIIKSSLVENLSKNPKVFVTPLEVGKFFQCPRRVWLEKVVFSTQRKEERGKMWDGEALHFAINQLAKNLEKGEASAVIEEAANKAVEKYAGKIEIGKEKLVEFLSKFYEFIKEEEIVTIFTEKLIESFSEGLVGTPDIIGIRKDGKVVPVDIKLGYLGRGLKKEHALQIIGESILTERFFRKSVEVAYLIYFESNSLVKIVVRDDMKREFLMYKKGLIKTFRSRYIPPISRLPNFKRRVCQGCHVKHACENIELLKRIY